MQVRFPKDVRAVLPHMPANTGIAWKSTGFEPKIMVKLSESLSLDSIELHLSHFEKDSVTSSHVHLMVQAEGDNGDFLLDCLIRPGGLDTSIFQKFYDALSIEFHAVGPDLTYLGTKNVSWTDEHRNQLWNLVSHFLDHENSLLVGEHMPQPPASCSALRRRYWQCIQTNPQLTNPKFEHYTAPYNTGAYLQFGYLVAYAQDIQFTDEHLAIFTQFKHYPFRYLRDPFWIECHLPLPGYARQHFAMLGFRRDHTEQPLLLYGNNVAYKYADSLGDWVIYLIDEHGIVFLRLGKAIQLVGEWSGALLSVCPFESCPFAEEHAYPVYLKQVTRCDACHDEVKYWTHHIEAFLVAALTNVGSLEEREDERVSEEKQPFLVEPPSKGEKQQQPVIVAEPLLIDRYVSRQQDHQRQTAIEDAEKFLWMHSAWAMTEALRPTTSDGEALLLSGGNIYIELEQPRTVQGIPFAACSFLQLPARTDLAHRRLYSLLDREGNTHWRLLYEYTTAEQPGTWTLPQDYQCPEQQCRREQVSGGVVFLLCERCQERVTHFTAWFAIALRMIAGDYQEQVEMSSPEEIVETSTTYLCDEQSGEIKEKKVLRRFRVIRYDACLQRVSNPPRSRRGSWMTNRPLAESEYDVNPQALIYVLIRPKDYDRTYRHKRFVNMLGKKQHIDPKRRFQPMTIATLKALPRTQRITRVYASAYPE